MILSGTTLYGVTVSGGANADGNIFSVGIDGTGYRDLYDFTGGTDGGFPVADLTLSGGTLFGMTNGGGTNGDGTVFALALPARPRNRARWRCLGPVYRADRLGVAEAEANRLL